MINTTPEFDKIGLTVPMERPITLRCFAVVRLFLVCLGLYVCVLQLFHVGVWSIMMDRVLMWIGVLAGLGRNSDGIEDIWSKVKPHRGLIALAGFAVIAVSQVMFGDYDLVRSVGFLAHIFLLGLLAYGLIRILMDPLRAARYRQKERYLRTLPKSERSKAKRHLNYVFQGLASEGFH